MNNSNYGINFSTCKKIYFSRSSTVKAEYRYGKMHSEKSNFDIFAKI